MKWSRFTQEQIVSALKEYESGGDAEQLCGRVGISRNTLYAWKNCWTHAMSVRESRGDSPSNKPEIRLQQVLDDVSLFGAPLQAKYRS